jgi:hypothetical protein
LYKFKRDFRNYKDLWAHEWRALHRYIEENNFDELTDTIKNKEMSPAMKCAVADMVTGKLRRPPGEKPSTAHRDLLITDEIELLLEIENYNLTSNANSDGAAAIVADKFGVSEDTAIQAYKREQKRIKDALAKKTLNELAKFMEKQN